MPIDTLLIAGGGIAGLATALAAGRRYATVLEQADEITEVGAGIQVGPNAVRALRRLGAWDAVEPIASSPPEIHMRDGLSGRLLKRIRLGREFEARFGAPYRVAHRADLQRALLQIVRSRPNLEVQTAARLLSLTDTGDRVIAILENGQSQVGDALVGADGVRSVVRQSIQNASPLVDSGLVLHRALFAAQRPPADVAMDCVNLWLCPGAHVVHYPVGSSQRLNVVVTAPASHKSGQALAGCCVVLQQIVGQAPEWLPWPAIYVRPMRRWSKGNVMVLGDAAHATVPFLAQGAAMALEDAAAFFDALESSASIGETFARVERARLPRTAQLLQESLNAGERYHARGAQRVAQNLGLRLLPPTVLLEKLGWIYRG